VHNKNIGIIPVVENFISCTYKSERLNKIFKNVFFSFNSSYNNYGDRLILGIKNLKEYDLDLTKDDIHELKTYINSVYKIILVDFDSFLNSSILEKKKLINSDINKIQDCNFNKKIIDLGILYEPILTPFEYYFELTSSKFQKAIKEIYKRLKIEKLQ
jgi:hypothetical protein